DAQPVSGLAHATFQDVAHFQLLGDLRDIDALALELERGVARDDSQRRHLTKVSDDVFADAVAEIFLLLVVAHIGEGQHADRKPRGARRGFRLGLHGENMNGPLDVFDRVLAHVFVVGSHFARQMIAHAAGYRHTARLSQSLYARRNIDAVAINVVAFYDHIAKIHTNAIVDAPRLGCLQLGLRCGGLDRERGLHSRDDARKFGQRAIADQLDDASAESGDLRVEYRTPVCLEPRQRALLISFHHAAIADDVGGHDGCQFARHAGMLRLAWLEFMLQDGKSATS